MSQVDVEAVKNILGSFQAQLEFHQKLPFDGAQ